MSAELMDGGVRGAFLTLDDVAEAVNALENEGVAAGSIARSARFDS
jgi:hypothetical protein